MSGFIYSDGVTRDRDEWYVALYRQHYNYLVKTGMNAGFEMETIRDCINQTFLSFIEKDVDWSGVRNVKHFIAVSFRNRLLNHATGKDSRLVLNEPENNEYEMNENREQQLIAGEDQALLRERLKRAFLALPPRCQLVIRLKYYEGLSMEQIAEKTGWSNRSIYNNLSVALKSLRGSLESSSRRPAGIIHLLLTVLA